LKPLREDQGWSQRDLAARSGVAQNTISQLERGERQAMPSTVRKLADALGVDPPVLMAESRIDKYTLHEQKAVSHAPSEDRMTQQDLEEIDRMVRIRELTRVLDREQALVRKEWYETGRWAEFYVSGSYEKWATAFAKEHGLASLLSNKVKGSLVNFVSNPEELYLQDIRTALRTYTGDLVAVRSRLVSNDPNESLRAAQIVSERAKSIVEEHDNYLQSYRRIPDRYYTDPAAHSRILKLQEALSEQRTAAAEDVRTLMDLYDASLDTLEDQILRMRKESDVLEEFVMQAHNWEG
jgi:HTH-type transcriptional regulator, competence development regulator